MSRWNASLPILAVLLLAASASGQQPAPAAASKEVAITSALSAAPVKIALGAKVMDWEGNELKGGTNGWTCMPDVPNSPGNDPMCLDDRWVKWAHAWMNKQPVQIEGVGLAYMLQGGTDASNTDPNKTEPSPGEVWVRSGPHVMVIVPDVALLEGLSTDPDSRGPWVMWKGTPYAHIMMPVR